MGLRPTSQGVQQHRTNVVLVEDVQPRVDENFGAVPEAPVPPTFDVAEFGVRQMGTNQTGFTTTVPQFGHRTVINKIDPRFSQEAYDQYAVAPSSSS